MESGDARPEALEGWDAICRDAGAHSAEAPTMLAAAKWIAKSVETLGVRPASVAERARGAGLGRYVAELMAAGCLSEKQAADALGNSFDRDCAARRIETSL
eukprot:12027818-Alexandrium_andersonii.AAC.1